MTKKKVRQLFEGKLNFLLLFEYSFSKNGYSETNLEKFRKIDKTCQIIYDYADYVCHCNCRSEEFVINSELCDESGN